MKHLKQGIAAFLAALLIMPTLPAAAEETAKSAGSEADQVWFNTGKLAVSVIDPSVSENEAYQSQWMDMFAEDGSYTINIPEENPFFPYEVQFTCNGETTNEWFMNPEDTVEVGGHTFHVNAAMDGTAVTQLSMNVAGKEVVVYPEEKEFTNDPEEAIATTSLTYDLSTEYLTVDLTKFTPVELTRVKIESLLAGSNAQIDTSKIAWTLKYDDYSISQKGDTLDLSICNGTTMAIMIVGEANQLEQSDKKYVISLRCNELEDWLTAQVYSENSEGIRNAANMGYVRYYTYDADSRYLDINYERGILKYYVGLQVNPQMFETHQYASLRAFDGKFSDPTQTATATDITELIFPSDMSVTGAGYQIADMGGTRGGEFTLVSYDSEGNVTGCLPMSIRLAGTDVRIYPSGLRDITTGRLVADLGSAGWNNRDRVNEYKYTLYKEYPADEIYRFTFRCTNYLGIDNSKVLAAYVGNYDTIEAAEAAGAVNIKDSLFAEDEENAYQADFSKGIVFSIFAQWADGTHTPKKYSIQTVNGTNSCQPDILSNMAVKFTGLLDTNGSQIPAYIMNTENDSYGEYNYHVMMVAPGTDMSNVAPTFELSDDAAKLYAEGSSSTEVSGKSYHNFSNGMLQYTASADDGKTFRNYWLKIIQANNDEYPLFVSSLTDESSETKYKDGVIYSNREMIIDSYHNNRHDIFLANIGTTDLQNIKAELESDTLQIGDYWELDGSHNLSGYVTASTFDHNNVAKLRIIAKDGVEAGTEVTGKLTISASGRTLMVLNLTGIIGDPVIVTKEIPAAVKYVPYGTMIQNSNKYSWNRISYRLYGGKLPEGMEIKINGEIYGVPKESGSFTFIVGMENGSGFSYSTSVATYTLTVLENTNENVENATDIGYELKNRLMDVIDLSSLSDREEQLQFAKTHSQSMVSKGEFSEYQAVYLDGVKLTEGKDYTAESGSTRITLTYETLMQSVGTHTMAIEFREDSTNNLKRVAQNYKANQAFAGNSSNSSGDNSNNGNNSSSDSNSDNDSDGAVVTAGTIKTITYTVQPGDTLSKIAKKYLESASLWRKIYEDNKSVIKNPNIIHVGQKLIINLSGTATAVSTTATVPTSANTYVVQPGDNMWKIARKVYGQGYAWRKIFDANRNVIANPGILHVGQVLLTP